MKPASTLQAFEKRLSDARWRPMPKSTAESSLAAALAERLRSEGRPTTATSLADRYYLLFWRFKWALAALVLIGAVGGAVGYESRQGTSRLAQVRQKLVGQGGSLNPIDLLPPTVPREQNFFAIDAIQACRSRAETLTEARYDLGQVAWVDEDHRFGEATDHTGAVTLDRWFGITQDRARPAGMTAVEALREAVRHPGGRMDELLAGVDRPFSQMVPSSRERFVAGGSSMSSMRLPLVANVHVTLSLVAHYGRVAAEVGETERAARAFAAVLHFSEAIGTDGIGLVEALVDLALNGIVTGLMPQALAAAGWNEVSLRLLEAELLRQDCLAVVRRGMLWETGRGMSLIADPPPAARDALHSYNRKDLRMGYLGLVAALAPQGVRDANAALYGEAMLDAIGPGGADGWIEAQQGEAWHLIVDSPQGRNGWAGWWKRVSPTRVVAGSMFPAVSNLMPKAARVSFERRAAAIACAVLRHRLACGKTPASPGALVPDFLPSPVEDPAMPGQWLKIRTDGESLRLWSVGPDRMDNGGDPEKDWVWELGAPPPAAGP